MQFPTLFNQKIVVNKMCKYSFSEYEFYRLGWQADFRTVTTIWHWGKDELYNARHTFHYFPCKLFLWFSTLLYNWHFFMFATMKSLSYLMGESNWQ